MNMLPGGNLLRAEWRGHETVVKTFCVTVGADTDTD